MNAASFISRRLRFQGRLAMASVVVSFFVMILAMAISSGFRTELRKGISSIGGDIQLSPSDMNIMGGTSSLPQNPSYAGWLDSLESVQEVRPVVYRAGIVRNSNDIQGVVFKGTMDGPDSLGVSIPRRLSNILGLGIGDEMVAYFIGDRMRVRKFRVVSLYDSVLGGDDNLVVFASLSDMQRVNGWTDQVSAIELILRQRYKEDPLLSDEKDFIGTYTMFATPEDEEVPVPRTSSQRYPQVFSWLRLIDFNVVIILLIMTLVAGFNMISGVLIILFRNISTIGVLKSLGMTDRKISEVFLRLCSNAVLKGMAVGNSLALLFCLLQGTTHFIKLNPENYFLSFVPIHLNLWGVIAVDVIGYVAIMLMLLVPCIFISKVDPARTVRAQ